MDTLSQLQPGGGVLGYEVELPKSAGNDQSIRRQLLQTKTRVEGQLQKVNEALAVLDSDQTFERNIETLLKGMRV